MPCSAGRAYVDVEGLALYPMFDDIANRRFQWEKLVADEGGKEMESGLLRLVLALFARMLRKLGAVNLDIGGTRSVRCPVLT